MWAHWFRHAFACRYKDDDAVGKKIPVTVPVEQGSSRSSSSDENENENVPRRRKRPRCLLRKNFGEKLADPVLSTLSVNKDLG